MWWGPLLQERIASSPAEGAARGWNLPWSDCPVRSCYSAGDHSPKPRCGAVAVRSLEGQLMEGLSASVGSVRPVHSAGLSRQAWNTKQLEEQI